MLFNGRKIIFTNFKLKTSVIIIKRFSPPPPPPKFDPTLFKKMGLFAASKGGLEVLPAFRPPLPYHSVHKMHLKFYEGGRPMDDGLILSKI